MVRAFEVVVAPKGDASYSQLQEWSARLRWGVVSLGGEDETGWSVAWRMSRGCSLSPRQLLGAYALLVCVSLAIALFFWLQGVTWVAPFSLLELVLVGLAGLIHARSAGDFESVRMDRNQVVVELGLAGRTTRVEWVSDWVSLECEPSGRDLIGLSSQGRLVRLGRFVRPEFRVGLALEMGWVLRQVRAASPGQVL